MNPKFAHSFYLLDGKQVQIINSGISKTDFVPNTPTSTQISVTGEICYGTVCGKMPVALPLQ